MLSDIKIVRSTFMVLSWYGGLPSILSHAMIDLIFLRKYLPHISVKASMMSMSAPYACFMD